MVVGVNEKDASVGGTLSPTPVSVNVVGKPAPDRSAAPSSRNRMFSVNDTNTVNGMATNNVGANDTRAMNQHCSKNSRH